MIRAFIALPLPRALQQTMRTVIEDLPLLPVRWVKPEAMHLTLKFLGNIAVEQRNDITQALEQMTQEISAFTVQMRSLGCFPTVQRPRILWMGCDDVEQKLASLQQHIAKALLPLHGMTEQQAFRPHITLGRFRGKQQPQTSSLAKYRDYTFGSMLVDEVHLFQSELHRQGARYSSLFVSPLDKNLCKNYNSFCPEFSKSFEEKVFECDQNYMAT